MAAELPPRSAIAFRYRQVVRRRRGLYVVGPARLRARSGLGLFSFAQDDETIGRFVVDPTAEPIRGFRLLHGGTHADVGREVVRSIGRSEEFSRLRAYRPGDPPRLVHWPSSARTGSLMVKEFDRSVVTEVRIFCDLHLLALTGLGDQTSVEYRLRAAASIAAEATRLGHLVQVVACKAPRAATRLAGGATHLAAILDWLAVLRPEGQGGYEEDVEAEAHALTRGSTAVLVMSTIHVRPQALERLIRLIRLRRVEPVAVLVDDRGFLKLRREQEALYRETPPVEGLVALLRRLDVRVHAISNFDEVPVRLAIPA